MATENDSDTTRLLAETEDAEAVAGSGRIRGSSRVRHADSARQVLVETPLTSMALRDATAADRAPGPASSTGSQRQYARPDAEVEMSAERRQQIEDEMIAEELAHTSSHITSLMTPVSITMAIVVFIVKTTEQQVLPDVGTLV